MRKHLLPLLLLLPFACFSQDATDTTGSDLSSEDASAILAHHNKARAEVNAPPLVWSATVAEHAQEWADSLVSNGCAFQHRQKNPYGENLFATSAPRSAFKPVTASENWYSEKARYTYSRIGEPGAKGAGHYTQMVWKKTTELGVGIATCPNGNTIVVANYNPKGNFLGEYPY